jgi:hypothetical protein
MVVEITYMEFVKHALLVIEGIVAIVIVPAAIVQATREILK